MKIKLLTSKEMRTKKPAELNKYVAELKAKRTELLELLNTGKEKSTHQLSAMKRSIAQAKTVISEQIKENK